MKISRILLPSAMVAVIGGVAGLTVAQQTPDKASTMGIEPRSATVIVEAKKARLRETGADRRNLRLAATLITTGWSRVAAALGHSVQLSAWECFQGGCMVTSHHTSSADLERALGEFAHVKEFRLWNAGIFRSAPISGADGSVDVTWIFGAPKEGAPAIVPDSHADDDADLPAKASKE